MKKLQSFKRMRKLILTLSIGLLMSSCATLFTGTTEQITIDSNVKKATIKFDGIKMGSTPFTSKVKKSFDGVVTVLSDGYEDERFQFQRSFNAISILNLTNILGWGIDFLTGAMNKFDMKGYQIDLEKVKQ